MLVRMRSETARGVRATVAAAALLIALTGCAGLPFGGTTPSAAPPASGTLNTERCGVNGDRIAGLVDSAVAQLGTTQESVLAGEIPNLADVLAPLQTDLSSFTEDVTDPEVLTAITDAQAALAGFSEIPAPQNVLEAAGYVQAFTAQITALTDAGTALQQLCTTP